MKQAIDAFVESKRTKGLAPATIESYADRLELLLASVMRRPIRAVNGRGAELYAAAQVGRAADTHQNALLVGRAWANWCVKQKWLRANPFTDVEPVGAKTYGADKARLGVDESRRLQTYCHAHASTDPGAVLTLAYLLLGPRASELVRRTVRDLDDGGRLLWIGKTKTKSGQRRLLVPDELVPLLVAIAGDRPGDAPLFAHPEKRRHRSRSSGGSAWTRYVAYGHVKRVCRAAGVPDLSPQAMRRTQATLATDAGATGLMVAAHLGHAVPAAPAVTGRAYVGRDAARDAQIERASRVIRGNNRGNRSVEAPG
ncbi:MAG: tyrosine-type recombinase/integrase [Minicystis sp.]